MKTKWTQYKGFPHIKKNCFPYFFNTFSILNFKSSIPYFSSFFEIFNHETEFCTLHNTAHIMNCFAFSKILLRYFKFLFHTVQYYLTHILANFNSFSRSWKSILKFNTFNTAWEPCVQDGCELGSRSTSKQDRYQPMSLKMTGNGTCGRMSFTCLAIPAVLGPEQSI